MDRRTFIRSLGCCGTALAASAAFAYDPIPRLAVRKIAVKVGATEPFSLLHVSDSHLSRVDARDGDAVRRFALGRSRIGRELGETYLDEAVAYARAKNLRLLHTGDFMDFVTEANLEYAERRIKTDDILAVPGNHEFWTTRATEAEEDKAPVAPRLAPAFPDGLPATVKEIHGVNFFLFDDAFRNVDERTAAAFEKTVAAGLPIVLAMHVPFSFILTPPEALKLAGVGSDDRHPTPFTRRFIARVRREPLVKAAFAGHLHWAGSHPLSATAVEFVAGALFAGDAAEISFT